MKKIMSALLLASSVFCFAGDTKQENKFEIPQNSVPGKVCILVADVGTIDTVAKTEEFLTRIKEFNTDDIPRPSAADKAANPSVGKQEVTISLNDNIRKYNEREREIAMRNRRMELVLEQLRSSILGSNKRDIVVAKNYMQTYLQPYSEFIQVIDRANSSLSEVEKAIGGNDQQDVASACMFITVIMQDLREETKTVQVGNTMVKRTWYTQKAVSNLRDFNGNIVYACNVVARASRRDTGASTTTGVNPASDFMEEVLKQVADKVAKHLLCTVNIECIGPKNDDEFDEDEVILMLDGNDFSSGDMVLTGKHVLEANADGYMPVKKTLKLKKGGEQTVKLKFKQVKKASAEQAQDSVDDENAE